VVERLGRLPLLQLQVYFGGRTVRDFDALEAELERVGVEIDCF
jgi:hypothetical protein